MNSVTRKLIILIPLCFILTSCNFTIPYADNTFGKQYFVSTVALIELHHKRTGQYPNNLDDLKYRGNWDSLFLSATKYTKVQKGYDLFVTRGWMGTPNLSFPISFKNGLGIQKTNVSWIKPVK